jgi:SSS family solute:Na+ symporter
MTLYFTAGGLLGSAWINLVQLVVLLAGFAFALLAIGGEPGGWPAIVTSAALPPRFLSFWGGGQSFGYLMLLVPAFIVSPGLLQKAYGARDERAVRVGIAANGIVLLFFAFVPALLGIAARVRFPGLPDQELALPTLLLADLPPAVGALALAAIFSAEVSTADAILFMLATSLSQDLYRRFVNPAATEAQVLRVARGAALAGGTIAIGLAIVSANIIGALSIFYTLLGVSLFVPLVAGLHSRPPGRAALASILAGVAAVLGARLLGAANPSLTGLGAAALVFALASLTRRRPAPSLR